MAQTPPKNSSDIPLSTILSFLNSIPNDEPSQNPPSPSSPPSSSKTREKNSNEQKKQKQQNQQQQHHHHHHHHQQQQQQQQQKCNYPSFRVPLTAPHIFFSPQNPNFRYLTLDHAFSRSFCQSLFSELTTHFSSQLTPGDTISTTTTTTKKDDDDPTTTTASDDDDDDDDESFLKTDILRATLPNGKIRGDLSTFLPSDDRYHHSLPHLHHFVSCITEEITRMTKSNLKYFRFSHVSLQLAKYPGDGISGYVRHLDAPRIMSSSSSSSSPHRLLTCVYYMNDEWNVSCDGGALRLHFKNDDSDNNDVTTTTTTEEDIYPLMDRMIIFRSDVVEHEVMPGFKTRYALTCWVYGTLIDQKKKEEVLKLWEGQRPTPLPPLCSAPSSSSSTSTSSASIFVSIACYRDPQVLPTLVSLYHNARYPHRIHVGICHQLLHPDDSHLLDQINTLIHHHFESYKIRYLAANAIDSTGPCNARCQVQSLYRGEDYYFQIDCHLRFRYGWDEFLIKSLEMGVAEQKNKRRNDNDDNETNHRVILTTYPPGYHVTTNDDDITYDEDPHPTILLPHDFDARTGMLRQKGRRVRRRRRQQQTQNDSNNTTNIIPALPLLAAGCLFTHGSFIINVPYDGTLHGLFLGEEMHLAVRAYALGYDFVAPSEVFCWHLWERGGEGGGGGGKNKNEEDEQQQQQQQRHTFWETWNGRGQKESLEKVRRLLLLSSKDDKQQTYLSWNHGRSLETFERELGVNFSNRTIVPRATPLTTMWGEYEEMEDVRGELDQFSERLVEALTLATMTTTTTKT